MHSRIEAIIRQGQEFASLVESRDGSILNILLRYESYSTARDEIKRTISCLRGLDSELPFLEARVPIISSFLPINQPLYSLTLFAIVPSLMTTDRIFVRPPLASREIVSALVRELDVERIFPAIEIKMIERREFVSSCVRNSTVTVFIGKYANALEVLSATPKDSLFVYSGAGVNPILVMPDADIELAAKKVVDVKTYNSGQDCAAPDSVLVHNAVTDAFIKRLNFYLETFHVGEYEDQTSQIGPLADSNSLVTTMRFISKHRHKVCSGGLVDAVRNIVYPTVIRGHLPKDRVYEELYAPVFFLASFVSDEDLHEYFSDSRYLEHAMYVSIFGTLAREETIKNSVFLYNKTILEVEKGNEEFGGYGRRANFVSSRRRIVARPILISREVWEFVNCKP